MAMLKDPVLGDDPDDPREPCECDVSAAKRQLVEAWADIMYENGLESRSGVSYVQEEAAITNLIDTFVEPVASCAVDCR